MFYFVIWTYREVNGLKESESIVLSQNLYNFVSIFFNLISYFLNEKSFCQRLLRPAS